jgi:hypothetical protein
MRSRLRSSPERTKRSSRVLLPLPTSQPLHECCERLGTRAIALFARLDVGVEPAELGFGEPTQLVRPDAAVDEQCGMPESTVV